MMEGFQLVGILTFLAVFIVLIIGFIKFYKKPVVTCKAKVISKRSSRNGANKTHSYFGTFEVNGECIEYRLFGYELYDSLIEGSEVTISYKGNVIVEIK